MERDLREQMDVTMWAGITPHGFRLPVSLVSLSLWSLQA